MAKQTFTTGQVLTAAQMTSLQQTAMLGGAASAKTASFTLVATDAGTAISMSSASATTITVNTALFAAGDTVHITNLGAGVCTITAGTATVNSSASLALAQYESGFLDFTSTSAAIFVKGAGAPATSGGMTLINTGGTTLTGATVTIGSIPSTYNNLQLIITNFKPATDNKFIAARFNSNSSALYVSDGLTDNRGAAATDTSMLLGFRNDNTTAEGLIQADFYNYANTTTWKMGKSVSFTNDATTPTLYNLWAVSQLWRNTSAITEINLSVESGGNFTSGTAYLYGVK